MTNSDLTEAELVFQSYLAAVEVFCAGCRASPDQWHTQSKEFCDLRSSLLPYAEAGDMNCRYALATIAYLGLACQSQAEYELGRDEALEVATTWWIAAAKQGCSWAVDNLIVSGQGPEADRTRAMAKDVERDSANLIGHDAPTGMPIYGPEFMREVTRRLYGVVSTGEQ